MTANGNAPLVTIVGRPNVGKSTLFNRLLARRRAITASMPGVTRDIVEEEFVLAGMPLRLLDTGGVGDDAGEFGAVVAERALAAADDAVAIMLVVAVEGITPEDERLADRLRAASDRVVVVVNKVDHPGREAAMWDFYRLGYETVIGVSAAHGRNISALREELARGIRRRRPAAGSAEAAQSTAAVIRLVIGGKPNTGKSTLLNRLLGEERALVSATPGTTRDPLSGRLDHGGVQIELIDTAGMRRRSKVQDAVEYYAVNRGAAALAGADVAVLLVDASEGLAEQDKRIAAIAMRRGVAVLIGLSKWDMLAEQPEPLAEQAAGRTTGPAGRGGGSDPVSVSPAPLCAGAAAVGTDRIRGGRDAHQGRGAASTAQPHHIYREAQPGDCGLGARVRSDVSRARNPRALRHPDRHQPGSIRVLPQSCARRRRRLPPVPRKPHPP